MDDGHGYPIAELIGAELSGTKRERVSHGAPAYLRHYQGVFEGGLLEDYRLAKLGILLENPRMQLPDLEERVQSRLPTLDGDRPRFTDEIYLTLSGMAGRYVRDLQMKFSSQRLSSLLREGEFEDLVEECVLKAMNHVPTYQSTSSFSSWYYKLVRNTFVDLLRKEVTHLPVKRFSEMFPNVTTRVEESFDVVYERTGYNFRPYMRDPLVTVVGNEVITAINQGYQLLKPEQQTALAYVAHEIPYNVIAALMGKSEDNVRVIVHRARSAIGSYLVLLGVNLPRRYLDRMIEREKRIA